jgi:hypothetical protein
MPAPSKAVPPSVVMPEAAHSISRTSDGLNGMEAMMSEKFAKASTVMLYFEYHRGSVDLRLWDVFNGFYCREEGSVIVSRTFLWWSWVSGVAGDGEACD